ncbi:hypothetical protein [Haliovirga abyssi]|uniref:Uncharacterized protein n=1 Tax=Haliovirga abyssi TaxID=2996794 RepID=A0AAU9DJH0_9FUSO|nr:hypothetical protein [Haliovirga abyssi]BDU50037.1 hypothetical protein HLVA_06060 [Haliovirga abyssi]
MKKISIILMALLLAFNVTVMADGFDDEGFGDDTVTTATDTAQDSSNFGDDISSNSEKSVKTEFSGKLKFDNRLILGDNNRANSNPNLDLNLKVTKANSELNATMKFNEDAKTGELSEGYLKLYYDNFDISAGKMKVVWGKGDKLHVVDNLNSENLTDFINQDYLDRKVAEKMIKINYYIGNGNLELVYTPEFTPNAMPVEDTWKTNQQKSMESILEKKVFDDEYADFTGKIDDAVNYIVSNNPYISDKTQVPFSAVMDVLKTQNSAIYDDMKAKIDDMKAKFQKPQKIEDGQFAARFTDSISGFDFGASYYYGKLRTPSFNPTTLDINYDKVQVIGAELGKVLLTFNTRAELAYYLTEDTDGTDPLVHNNKIAWIVGADRDLPIHNMNINFQVKSEKILNDDKISASDVDYNKDGYFTDMIVGKIGDKFKNETILPEVQFVYNVESKDYMVNTQVEYKLKDDTSMTAMYKIFGGDNNTIFGEFDKNDYAALNFEYDF